MLSYLFDEQAELEKYTAARDKEKLEEGRAEGRVEGRAEGKTEGWLEAFISLVKDGVLTIADAAKRANMSVSEFESLPGMKKA